VPAGKGSVSFRTIDDIDFDQLSHLLTDVKRLMT
jgi:hypothetical protein